MIFLTIFRPGYGGRGGRGGGLRSTDTRGRPLLMRSPCLQSEETRNQRRKPFFGSNLVGQGWITLTAVKRVSNTAIFREATRAETLSSSSCTLPLLVVVALVYREQWIASGLCFALPSHSDDRASHVLLPIFTFFMWLLFFALDVF